MPPEYEISVKMHFIWESKGYISSLMIRFKEADDLHKMASDWDKLGNVRYFILLKVEDTKKYLKNPLGLFV